MRINSIENYNILQSRRRNDNKFVHVPTFKAIPLSAKTPQFKTQNAEKIYNQVYKIFNITGENGKLGKRFMTTINGKNYCIDCNRQNLMQQRITIKDNIENLSDWDKAQKNQTVVELFFNQNGMLDNGSLTKEENNGFYRSALFRREGNTHRVLHIEGVTYRPTKGNDIIWQSDPDLSYNRISQDIDLTNKFGDLDLFELFFEFIKPYKRILPITKD